MKKMLNIFEKVDYALFSIAQLAVFVMMLITMADVIMRYVFNQSIIIAYTFSGEYLMVILVFLSMSYVMKMGGHIKLDLLADRLPPKMIKTMDIIYLILAAGIMAVIGYQAMLLTHEAYVRNYTAPGIVPWPTWLSLIWVPIGSFMFAIRLIIMAIQDMLNFNKKNTNKNKEEHITE